MPPKETSDRATRLAALLASKNVLIRREAADALGHFPFTNLEIRKLIRSYLHSSFWEARVAASEALQSILKESSTSSQDIIPSTTLLSQLDPFITVRDFYPLLSCESELVTRVGSTSSYGEQRKLVDEQLDMQLAAGISSQSFISEDDFGTVAESSSEQKLRLDTSALSLREEVIADEKDSCVRSFCCEMLEDLASPKWEVRHGGALGLVVILKYARSCFSPCMIDVVATRLFQTLALDTFIDFASGRSAVGPVRETVAECIAALVVAFPHQNFLDLILKHLHILASMDDKLWREKGFDWNAEARKHLWLQRQAAVLVLKYHLAGPLFYVKFDEFYDIISLSFEDPHDEVSSTALTAVTALYCKKNLPENISNRLSNIESIIYRFIDSACNPNRQQVVDVDTVIVDLLALLLIWMNGSNHRNLPCSVLINLSHLLNPLHVTRSLRIVNVFSTSFSRTMLKREESYADFEQCAMAVISSLYRLVLFASPRGTDEVIEASILCSYCIASQFLTLNRLPGALVETIGRWSACLLLDAKNAEIELVEYNVSRDGAPGKIESLCGEEIRSMNDMERIDALLIRKIQIARFLAPMISAIYDFPSVIGEQSLCEAVQLLISPILTSALLMHRLGGSLLVHSWFTYNWRVGKNMNPPVFVITLLQKMALSSEVFYDDEKFFFHYLDSAYKEFSSYCRKKGVTEEEVLKVAEEGDSLDLNAGKLYDLCCGRMKKEEDLNCLTLRYGSFKNVVATAKAVMTANITRVSALIVSALLLSYPRILLESSTLNPFIKPLLGLLRHEENINVARHILNSLPILFRMTSEKVPCPHAKMVKQIVACLTSSESFFPQDPEKRTNILLSQLPRSAPGPSSLVAESAIRALTDPFAATDLNNLLDFRKRDSDKEIAMLMVAHSVYSDEIRNLGLPIPSLVHSFLPFLKDRLCSEDATLRYCSCRCLVEIARLDGMLSHVLKEVVIPLADSMRSGTASVPAKCGLAELSFLLSDLNLEILGGLRILAPISLRQMSDNCEYVREAAAVTFRNYVPLMVLKTSARDGKPMTANDLADKDVTDCSMDILLGNPSKLPPLDATTIFGLDKAVVLRHYQEEGIRWMSFIEHCGVNGILADDMGLGKTLQTLCLLALKLYDKPSAKVLIVCPPTLVNHWCTEWSKYFPTLPSFHAIDEGMREQRLLAMSKDQVVTVASYNTVRSCSYFKEFEWYYLILDEGHVIRNPTTQMFKSITALRSQNRLILSGTPVQNTPADLWALFEFLMPGYLGSMKQFKTTFLKSINACRNVNATPKEIEEGQAALERLHKSVLPFVMRRLKTDVLEDLPEKIVQDCVCEMTTIQRALYAHIVAQCNVGQPAAIRAIGLSALEVLAELRKCIVHPALVGPKAFNGFHNVHLQKVVEESGKLMTLRELFKQCGIGKSDDYEIEDCAVQDSEATHMDFHRALVFCQRLSTVQLIAELIDTEQLGSNIRYAILDGTVPVNQRHNVAENFNNDVGIDVLLLTTSVGGEGLNLTGADVVIFVEHDWNPVKDLQAMDRAHRIGQKRTVNVYRLITKSSIEEKIMRYQKFKADTANALVGADNKSLQTMATEQLVELFALESSKGAPDASPRTVSKSKKKDVKIPYNVENPQSWDIEELWNLSQYDRFNVVNIAQSAEEVTSRELKRQYPVETDLPALKQRRDV